MALLLENVVANALQNLLGSFFHNVDKKNLKLSVFSGDIVLRDLPVAPKQVNKAVVEEQLAAVLAEVQAGDAASAAQQAGALAAALNEARQTGVDLSTPAAHQWPLLLLQPHSCLRRVTCLPT